MDTIAVVTRGIQAVERFPGVAICYPDGHKVRDDKGGYPAYDYARAAKGSMTLAEWHRERFDRLYPGLVCVVADASGAQVHGATLLRNIRLGRPAAHAF